MGKSKKVIFQELEDERIEEKEQYREIKDMTFNNMSFNEVKEQMPSIVEDRKNQLIEYIQAYMFKHDLKNIPYQKLYELMSSGNAYNRTKYSAEELAIHFEVYKTFTAQITEKNPRHFPTKQNFCSFIGVSTKTLDNYALSDDPNMQEVCLKIDDYLTDVQLVLAQTGVINAVATIFRMKTEHDYVETKEIVKETIVANVDRDSIRERINKAKETAIIDAEIRESK